MIREPKPFLKWAGGKSQLLGQMEPFFPNKIGRYIEPFVGGGAVYFRLRALYPGMAGIIRDSNPDLINCYTVVRDQPDQLMDRLAEHLKAFLAAEPRLQYYQAIRAQHDLVDSIERAARMIFLNKTCFNGLWRVNSQGRFNVPMGNQKNPTLYDWEDLLAASAGLEGTRIEVGDYREGLEVAAAGDFVYLDPPYHPVSATSSFKSYAKDEFGVVQQQELAERFAAAAQRGVLLMLSNSDTPYTRELYHNFRIETLQAKRFINATGTGRGRVAEILVLANLVDIRGTPDMLPSVWDIV